MKKGSGAWRAEPKKEEEKNVKQVGKYKSKSKPGGRKQERKELNEQKGAEMKVRVRRKVRRGKAM